MMRLKLINFGERWRMHNMNKAIRSSKYYIAIEVPDNINSMIIGHGDKISFLRNPIPTIQIPTNTANNNQTSIPTPDQTSNRNPNQNLRLGSRNSRVLISLENIDITSKISNTKFRPIFIKTYPTVCNIE